MSALRLGTHVRTPRPCQVSSADGVTDGTQMPIETHDPWRGLTAAVASAVPLTEPAEQARGRQVPALHVLEASSAFLLALPGVGHLEELSDD